MKASVERAKNACPQSATADRSRRSCSVLIVETRKRVNDRMLSQKATLSWRLGQACSNAVTPASGSLTAASTDVRRSVTARSCKHHIARGHLTSSRIVLVERRLSTKFPPSPEIRVEIPSRAARSLAARCCRVATNATRFVILEIAVLAGRRSPSNADVEGLNQRRFVTKAETSLRSACESAERC